MGGINSGRKIKLKGKQVYHKEDKDTMYLIKQKGDNLYKLSWRDSNHAEKGSHYSGDQLLKMISDGVLIVFIPDKNKTPNAYEEWLNDYYATEYDGDWMRVKKDFACLELPDKHLWDAYEKHKLGTRLRKHSPDRFLAGFNDWQRK